MDDDLNSSDIEFEAPPVHTFAKAGARSIEEMLQHAVEDRLASKKRSKQLTFIRGSKKMQYRNHLWYVLYKSTLPIRGGKAPFDAKRAQYPLSLISSNCAPCPPPGYGSVELVANVLSVEKYFC
jgi:hypothetical protein